MAAAASSYLAFGRGRASGPSCRGCWWRRRPSTQGSRAASLVLTEGRGTDGGRGVVSVPGFRRRKGCLCRMCNVVVTEFDPRTRAVRKLCGYFGVYFHAFIVYVVERGLPPSSHALCLPHFLFLTLSFSTSQIPIHNISCKCSGISQHRRKLCECG